MSWKITLANMMGNRFSSKLDSWLAFQFWIPPTLTVSPELFHSIYLKSHENGGKFMELPNTWSWRGIVYGKSKFKHKVSEQSFCLLVCLFIQPFVAFRCVLLPSLLSLSSWKSSWWSSSWNAYFSLPSPPLLLPLGKFFHFALHSLSPLNTELCMFL